ncbi:ATP-dependent sacrificial sulfur transferase LarE [Ligilactobacillus equi]|nr:ATP-dependent sacrificial sulfur transferase LarE [Ligilactobacillus equi]MCQ2557430.1 ATP-dependent sacrificial sulfur transferase LarE [Ligilactobacillus sp.]
MTSLDVKESILVDKLAQLDNLVIAYSGGIDSTYLLKIALDTLGSDKVLAVVMNSELFLDDEFNKAVDLANDMGAQVLGLEMSELADAKIAANTPKSWYYSKKLLYKTIKDAVAADGFTTIADGMIMDDNEDFRPGLIARDEEGVRSFLQEADLYKADIRILAKENGIVNWNKVASCSVASRFPYGTRLTQTAVNRVFASEKYLREDLGYKTVRVRCHGDLARVELPETDLQDAWDKKDEISATLRKLGFNYTTFDMQAFKSGRMNEVLSTDEKLALV